MPQPPAGAQISEDGNYWWDANANAWQLIEHNQAQHAAGGAAHDGQAAGAQASNAPHVTADHVADMMASAEHDAAEIA
jgi:hypothetical protein